MASSIQKNFRARKTFAKLKQVIEIPNLIDIQKRSYDKFLQLDIPVDKREDIGIQGVFKSVFPIKDFSETSSLEFVSYNLERPQSGIDLITSKEANDDGYFMMTITAGKELEQQEKGMDYVFIRDVSGSMALDGKLGTSRFPIQAFDPVAKSDSRNAIIR